MARIDLPGALDLDIPTESWVHPALVLRPSPIDGQGIFTLVSLLPNTRVIAWGGEIFTSAQVLSGCGRQHTLVGIAEDIYLGNDAEAPPGIEDYMNHSCDPNVGMRDSITLVTTREVSAGEELTADYAIWLNDETYLMKRECNCKAALCRQIVRGTDWRKPSVQMRNAGFFSPFIELRIEAARRNL